MRFFFLIQRKSRSFRIILVLGLLPIGLSLFFVFFRHGLETHEVGFSRLYPQMGFFFYLHLLLPLLSALTGPALFAEEARMGTLGYLWTRPLPRWKAFLSKYVVQWSLLSVLLCGSLMLCFTLLTLPLGPEVWMEDLPALVKGMATLLFGSAAYLALFFLFGVLFRKAVPMSLLFSFGWENLIGYFPARIQRFTIIHHLHGLSPTFFHTKAQGLLGLLQRDSRTIPTWESAILFLVLIIAASLSMALVLVTRREATNPSHE